MSWTELPIPLIEENQRFFSTFLGKQREHGEWLTVDLFGPFACQIEFDLPWAYVDKRMLRTIPDLQPSRTIKCWSLKRRFYKHYTLSSVAHDLEFTADEFSLEGSWEFTGKLRRRFIKSNAGAKLHEQYLVAKLTENRTTLENGYSVGALVNMHQ